MKNIDINTFQEMLAEPLKMQNQDVDEAWATIAEQLYGTCEKSVKTEKRKSGATRIKNANERWSRLVYGKDDKGLWRAINWDGSFNNQSKTKITPSDAEFKEHFNQLLNPSGERGTLKIPANHTLYIPVLDDPITPQEVARQVKSLKTNKSAGPDGIPPGIFKFMSDEWIFHITTIMNLVFEGKYPTTWEEANLYAIYKKGDAKLCSNYRGITVMNAIAKLYDKVLAARFELWYRPLPEQAGAQKGRGCSEQIAAIRILIDSAKARKKSLFITFVDYEKAFDRVSRQKLINLLAEKGCGQRFLLAIAKSLEKTVNVIGKETLNTVEGVKQGGATSCALFTFYLDFITANVNSYGNDDYLGDLHSLLLMDDTAIIATSRESMQSKLNMLVASAGYLNMKLHPTKCEYIAVNANDTSPFYLEDCKISHTRKYKYLGAIISNESMVRQLEDHATASMKHVIKFHAFTYKHNDAPYWIKNRVLESCVTSALLYSCESWLSAQMKPIAKVYTSCLKQLLGVRSQTSQDIVYTEAGASGIEAIVMQRQQQFFRKHINAPDRPLTKAYKIAEQCNAPSYKYINRTLQATHNFIEKDSETRRTRMNASTATKVQTYLKFNPELTRNVMYDAAEQVPEYARLALTKFRTSSHYLKIETGRWSRTPRENRTCQCKRAVQDEEHIITTCPLTIHLHPGFNNLTEALEHPTKDLSKIIYNILNFYQSNED
jgi:hypothetical protein